MRKTEQIIFVTILALLASTSLHAQTAVSVKDILMQALNSEDGAAKGIVEGKEADAIHAATGANDPIRAEVTTLKRFKQEGCSRLAMKLIQPNTPTKQGVKVDFALNYELNLCKNGSPPTEGMDLGGLAKIKGN